MVVAQGVGNERGQAAWSGEGRYRARQADSRNLASHVV